MSGRIGSWAARAALPVLAVVMSALPLAPGLARAATPNVQVSDARMQVIMAGRPAAGYFVLKNNAGTDVSLTGASAPDCASLMMHKSNEQGGMARMEMVQAVRVPGNGSVRFAPGGYHLMCMEPKGVLLSGKGTETVTLEFADGSKLQAPFAISGVGR